MPASLRRGCSGRRLIGQRLLQIEDLALHPHRIRPLLTKFVIRVQRVGNQLMIFKDGGFRHQRRLILWIRRQRCFILRQLGLHIGGELVVRRGWNLGLVQTTRHADAVVLLAGGRYSQCLRQCAGPRRLLGNLAGSNFGSLRIQADCAGWSQRIERFAGTKQERRRTGLRSYAVAGEQQIARTCRERRFCIGAKQLAAGRRKNQTHRFFLRIPQENGHEQ